MVLRICPEEVIEALMKPNYELMLGFEGIFMGENGTLTNEEGMVLREMKEAEMKCMAVL